MSQAQFARRRRTQGGNNKLRIINPVVLEDGQVEIEVIAPKEGVESRHPQSPINHHLDEDQRSPPADRPNSENEGSDEIRQAVNRYLIQSTERTLGIMREAYQKELSQRDEELSKMEIIIKAQQLEIESTQTSPVPDWGQQFNGLREILLQIREIQRLEFQSLADQLAQLKVSQPTASKGGFKGKTGTYKNKLIMGPQNPCHICGLPTHWANKCPLKGNI
jgi:hypothetical protein